MDWNLRVIRHEHAGEEYFLIHEVYHDGAGNPVMYTGNPVVPRGETLDELKRELDHFQAALAHPVLRSAKNGRLEE